MLVGQLSKHGTILCQCDPDGNGLWTFLRAERAPRFWFLIEQQGVRDLLTALRKPRSKAHGVQPVFGRRLEDLGPDEQVEGVPTIVYKMVNFLVSTGACGWLLGEWLVCWVWLRCVQSAVGQGGEEGGKKKKEGKQPPFLYINSLYPLSVVVSALDLELTSSICAEAYNEEGLFRVSGQLSEVRGLKERFDRGNHPAQFIYLLFIYLICQARTWTWSRCMASHTWSARH